MSVPALPTKFPGKLSALIGHLASFHQSPIAMWAVSPSIQAWTPGCLARALEHEEARELHGDLVRGEDLQHEEPLWGLRRSGQVQVGYSSERPTWTCSQFTLGKADTSNSAPGGLSSHENRRGTRSFLCLCEYINERLRE